MENKIKFYEEIFNLDPNSKVFFPLASMYYAESNTEKAEEILNKGLKNYPDHLQARLLLARIYFDRQKNDSAGQIVEEIMDTIMQCPPFFTLWEDRLRQKGQKQAATFLSILATNLTSRSLNLEDIFSAGLNALMGGEDFSRDSVQSQSKAAQPREKASEEVEWEEYPPETVPESSTQSFIEAETAAGEEPDEDADADEVDESEMEAGVKTKSMADVLFSQGEYSRALKMYEELMSEAAAGPERKELAALVEKTRKVLEHENQKASSSDIDEDSLADLESLAQRLERRAREAGIV